MSAHGSPKGRAATAKPFPFVACYSRRVGPWLLRVPSLDAAPPSPLFSRRRGL